MSKYDKFISDLNEEIDNIQVKNVKPYVIKNYNEKKSPRFLGFNFKHLISLACCLLLIAIVIIIRLEKNREFIKKAFKVEGQNSFKEILGYKIYNIFIRIIDKHELNELYYSNVLTKENMARYYTNGFVSFIELWVDKGCEYSGIDMFEAYNYMVSHSIMDIIKK